MLKSLIVQTVVFCTRRAWWVILAGAVLMVVSSGYAVRHFAITTDVNHLIAPDLPWTKREIAFMAEFPTWGIMAVVDAPTPELASVATSKLAAALSQRTDVIRAVRQAGGGSFFQRNGMLFLSPEELARATKGLVDAEPMLETLAADPSLRGELDALSFGVMGVQRGQLKLDDLTRPLTRVSDTLDNVLEGRSASFSWRLLASNEPPHPRELLGIIQIDPKLDFTALSPGRAATDAVQQTARDLNLARDYQARVRLTGRVPIDDDEFATLKQGAALNATVSITAVLIILWLALRSWRIILAVAVSLVVGLAATAALGLLMVGALNLISIAFAALFIGLGVDFGIQFSVRYRSERHEYEDIHTALKSAAEKAGGPLALAAAATTIGFFSFLPTDYLGLSELGQIAGCGMLIAFAMSITLLPALLRVFNPPGELHSMGFTFLAPVDRFTERHRFPILIVTLAIVVALAPLLYFVRFDFNPLNLRSPKVESVATFLDLRKDPEAGANSIEISAPSLDEADATAKRLSKLPEVSRAMTLSSFVPDGQDEKIKQIHETADAIDSALNPKEPDPPPTDQENIDDLTATAESLRKVAGDQKGPGAAAARRAADLFTKLAGASPDMRATASQVFVVPLKVSLDGLRQALKPEKVSIDNLPEDLKSDWVAGNGHARVQLLPKGDPNDNDVLRSFATAVLKVEPNATGAAVDFLESGSTIVRAFLEAGICALVAIALLLWITLRRIGDVLLTLVPLLVAGVVTMEICVIIDLRLNFANIIALPLLLGVGVAFKIYYIMAWRAGKTALLQSTLTRAVIFSAMTTATAFGSLWLSNHPGTSSMGKLMALSLVCTLAAAVLFQPVLMGPPRET
jgi:hopanoid biosynthesis associated RND transporter like protein HpnN